MASAHPAAAAHSQTDFAVVYLDRVRTAIAPQGGVLEEARRRRNHVTKAVRSFLGALRSFNSGSLAHGDVNDPVSDGDCGGVLDRRH